MQDPDELTAIGSVGPDAPTEPDSFEERPCFSCGRSVKVPLARLGGTVRHAPATAVLCPDCEVLWGIQAEQEAAAEEAKRRRAQVDHYLGRSDLPDRLQMATFATFGRTRGNSQALEVSRRWMELKERPNLIIHGPIGSGKSYLAACVFHGLLERQVPALWLRAPMLLAQIKRGFRYEDAREQADELCRLAARAELLFLDDLGKTHPGRDVSWVEEQLYLIVDRRYGDMLPTVVTTEWEYELLAERVGESVASRLLEGALLVGLEAPTRPYRQQKEDG
ncbi:MAG: ATP-binding protein [Armatimonadetes bacterium]|nr:ATP-binding protein [Armatimonadota bacterium]